MILDVYKITINSTIPDRNHSALFVQAEADAEEGYLVHVLGDVQSGYTIDIYGGEEDTGVMVEQIHGYLRKELIGFAYDDRLSEFMDVCQGVPPPGVQMNPKGVKIDASKGYVRDSEWVEEVIEKLKDTGLLTLL